MPAISRKRKNGVEEITFDRESRQEYLTGFHKRKLQRVKHAQQEAEKQAKIEKLEERRKLREARKEQVEAHIKALQAASRKAAAIANGEPIDWSDDDNDDDEESEWEGIDEAKDSTLGKVNEEAQYIDEDKFTTVTVETMDLDKDEDESEDEAVKEEKRLKAEAREKEEEKRKKRKPKEKKNKFRYLTKSERKQDRAKIRASKAKRRGDKGDKKDKKDKNGKKYKNGKKE
ncbi:hypothetical protein RUND412_000041 [Rhizina undulata]